VCNLTVLASIVLGLNDPHGSEGMPGGMHMLVEYKERLVPSSSQRAIAASMPGGVKEKVLLNGLIQLKPPKSKSSKGGTKGSHGKAGQRTRRAFLEGEGDVERIELGATVHHVSARRRYKYTLD
jgi:hypothetical protein